LYLAAKILSILKLRIERRSQQVVLCESHTHLLGTQLTALMTEQVPKITDLLNTARIHVISEYLMPLD